MGAERGRCCCCCNCPRRDCQRRCRPSPPLASPMLPPRFLHQHLFPVVVLTNPDSGLQELRSSAAPRLNEIQVERAKQLLLLLLVGRTVVSRPGAACSLLLSSLVLIDSSVTTSCRCVVVVSADARTPDLRVGLYFPESGRTSTPYNAGQSYEHGGKIS